MKTSSGLISCTDTVIGCRVVIYTSFTIVTAIILSINNLCRCFLRLTPSAGSSERLTTKIWCSYMMIIKAKHIAVRATNTKLLNLT